MLLPASFALHGAEAELSSLGADVGDVIDILFPKSDRQSNAFGNRQAFKCISISLFSIMCLMQYYERAKAIVVMSRGSPFSLFHVSCLI